MAPSPRPVLRWIPALSLVLLLPILFASCGDSGPNGPDPLDAIATVTVAPTQVTLDVGSDQQLAATVKDGHGKSVASSVTWSSSASGVASVNSSGLVSGVTEGTATITALAGGKSGTAAITVNDPFPPAQPTNVTATPVSDTGIRITWTDASNNEDSFKIERELQPNPVAGERTAAMAGAGPESGNGPQLVKTVAGTVNADATSFGDTGLQAGSVYRYWVSACNENGCSDTQQSANDIATYATLVITTESLPAGWVGEAYNQTLTSTGGGGEPQWVIIQGYDPFGLTLSPTGTLSGTPTNSGTTDFTVQASGGGQDVSQALSLTIYGQVAVETTAGPNGAVGFAYSQTLEASGGDGAYLWAQEGGTMPPGLVLGPDGSISGTPTATGTYDFQVVVHSTSRQATGTVTITIFDSVCPVQTEIPFSECQVLNTLYTATDGDNWDTNTDWFATLTPCSWYGVNCEQESVQLLRLKNNNLTGTIPPGLGSLSGLGSLQITGNDLSGSIPAELGNLSNLTALDLSGNGLTGTIPPALGNLSNLQNLNLSNQELSGSVPPELGNLTGVIVFRLESNQLSGTIPPELGNLTTATAFYLSNNQLTGPIPPELGNMANVRNLYLQFNQLSGSIPPELGNLSNLAHLQLGSNALTGSIPPGFGALADLQTLRLFGNQLTGSIPTELGNLTKLTLLYLYSNQLTGSIPAEIGNLTALQNVILDSNQLSGVVPLGVAQLGGGIQNTYGAGYCAFRPGNAGLSLVDNQDYRAADLDTDGFICGVPFPAPMLWSLATPLF